MSGDKDHLARLAKTALRAQLACLETAERRARQVHRDRKGQSVKAALLTHLDRQVSRAARALQIRRVKRMLRASLPLQS